MSCDLDFAFDQFADRARVQGEPIGKNPGALTDTVVSLLRQHILDRFGFDAGKENVFDAALQLCHEHGFDPVEDHLAGLAWDGRPRLDAWLSRYLGAADNSLHRAFGALVLIAAVRRVRRPGCKFDFVPVLEGLSQGEGKSSAFCILAGDDARFTDQDILHLNAREQQEAIAGKWIVELSELAGLARADIERTKSFIRAPTTAQGPPMDAQSSRRCVFVGTTNQGQYLRDATGNRRFWPVRVGAIDLAALRTDRDQIWAEAAAREAAGESVALPAELWALATEAQAARMEEDPWMEALSDLRGKVANGEERIGFSAITRRLGLSADRQSNTVAKRIADCMRRLGWVKLDKPFKLDGKTTRGYLRPADCNPM